MKSESISDEMRDAEEHRLSSCEGKSIYLSWSMAHAKARTMTRRSHDRGDRIVFHPYRCAWGHIHIGTSVIIAPTHRKPVRTHRRKGVHRCGFVLGHAQQSPVAIRCRS